MSASQALAAARRRRGSNAPVSNPVVKQQTRVETQREPVSKININQYVVFLNNKIETIENRVNESLQKLEERIDKEISKMEVPAESDLVYGSNKPEHYDFTPDDLPTFELGYDFWICHS